MSTPDRYTAEKRDFIRMTVESPAKLIFNQQSLQCQCLDLSATGARVLCEQAIPVGTQLTLEIPSQIEKFDSLVTHAVVMRCDQQDNYYEIGLKVEVLD